MIVKYKVWLNYLKEPKWSKNGKYEIQILYFENAYKGIERSEGS